jgi:hypothetical protein
LKTYEWGTNRHWGAVQSWCTPATKTSFAFQLVTPHSPAWPPSSGLASRGAEWCRDLHSDRETATVSLFILFIKLHLSNIFQLALLELAIFCKKKRCLVCWFELTN